MQMMLAHPYGDVVGAEVGTYTRLVVDGVLMMSDTRSEILDHRNFIGAARGRVLVGGLGLGLVVAALACRDTVTSIDVVEYDPRIISLIEPRLRGQLAELADHINIIADDVFTWKPDKDLRWDCAWWDIWSTAEEENLAEMTTLHRRFGHKVGFQDSWKRKTLRNIRRRDQDSPRSVFGSLLTGYL